MVSNIYTFTAICAVQHEHRNKLTLTTPNLQDKRSTQNKSNDDDRNDVWGRKTLDDVAGHERVESGQQLLHQSSCEHHTIHE